MIKHNVCFLLISCSSVFCKVMKSTAVVQLLTLCFVSLRMTAVTCVKLLVLRSQTTLQESAPPSADSAGWPSENLWDPLSAFIYRCRSYLLTGWFSGCVRLRYPDAGPSWTKWHKQRQSLSFWIHAAWSQFGFWIHLLELCLFSCKEHSKNTEFCPVIYMLEKTQLHKCFHILSHTSGSKRFMFSTFMLK